MPKIVYPQPPPVLGPKKSAPHDFKYKDNQKMVGVEFEGAYNGGPVEAIIACRKFKTLQIYPERDGVMQARPGEAAEMVVHPVAFDTAIDPNGPWKRFLNAMKKAGHYSTEHTGMHVNINCPDREKEGVTAIVGNYLKSLGEVVGRRRDGYNHYATHAGQWPFQNMVNNGGYYYYPQKGMAVAARTGRVEFRLHRSTINWDHFRTSILYSQGLTDFVADNLAYIKNHQATFQSLDKATRDVLDWMSAHPVYAGVIEGAHKIMDDKKSVEEYRLAVPVANLRQLIANAPYGK